MGRFFAAILALLILLAVLGAAALLWGNQQFKQPGPLLEDHVVVLPRGAGLGRGRNEGRKRRGIEYMWTERCARYKPRQDVKQDVKMIVSFDRIGFGIG